MQEPTKKRIFIQSLKTWKMTNKGVQLQDLNDAQILAVAKLVYQHLIANQVISGLFVTGVEEPTPPKPKEKVKVDDDDVEFPEEEEESQD